MPPQQRPERRIDTIPSHLHALRRSATGISMLTLLGFLTFAFPEFLELIKDRQDRQHELTILNRQMEMQKLGHAQRLGQIAVAADIAESHAPYRHDAQPSGRG